MMSFRELVVSSYPARANDIVKAVHLLRQHGMAVGFPMQTADGQIIFPVGKDFTLTADQILELLERGELDAEGVRRSVKAQASATPIINSELPKIPGAQPQNTNALKRES